MSFAQLIPVGLNLLQNDSNRRAQMEQQRINTEYSPWLNNNTQAYQTNAGDVISQGIASYMAGEHQKKREAKSDSMFEKLFENSSQMKGTPSPVPQAQHPQMQQLPMGMQNTLANSKFNFLQQPFTLG